MSLQKRYNFTTNPKNDILSGTVVAVALIPEAIAFSLIAGLSPQIGLYTAFILGLITALIGGKPGMISGATGAVAVVLVDLVIKHGVEYMFWAAILAGIFQVLIGVLRLGKFIRLVPQPAIYGFVNGLAIVIATSQIPLIKDSNLMTIFLIVLTMAIIYLLPRFTKAIPASLGALIAITALVLLFNIDTKQIKDLADISGSFPTFHIPTAPLNFETIQTVLPYSVIIALVGLIESLLTLSVLDEMSGERGSGNQECIAQGVGNMTCGLFGAMPGCAMIGQSMINFTSGGTGRLSSLTAAVLLILFVAVLSKYISLIPLAALVGIMFVVAIATFSWSSLGHFKRMPKEDLFVMVAVTIITIFADLAIAVIAGVIISALVFAWKHAKIYAKTHMEGGRKIYELEGPLFFGSVHSFLEKFDPKNDPFEVVIDFKNARVMDQSGVEAIDKITRKYKEAGKSIVLRHLSPECKQLLTEAGPYCTWEEDDPNYRVAIDY
ncbi:MULTISPECIES: SulP family inorganic anion transporter [unclassified Nitratiruptor]|uniref:SulP family inorganic anion transporter n=1 Tax=unclassified Nitratiruptor TaxID=2624044 RepID=UPI001914E9F0|nr:MULTISPECIES: SulP family inorganic anion transporter [unclassified Nitratiruptor]BCD60271.1 sulfate permease, SulP family [Nitratiruptor sp. YY08-10]BCD64240.1 sulfate permease, SulP family [Nitratiruptor sp. YY08-14]